MIEKVHNKPINILINQQLQWLDKELDKSKDKNKNCIWSLSYNF